MREKGFDLWWNPATIAQATGRAFRSGQEKSVFEYLLLTRKTIEERIFKIIESKRQIFDNVVDDLSEEAVTRTMTTEEIFGLFGLNAPKTSTKPPVPQNIVPTLPPQSRLASPSPPAASSPPMRTNRHTEFKNDALWDNWWQQ